MLDTKKVTARVYSLDNNLAGTIQKRTALNFPCTIDKVRLLPDEQGKTNLKIQFTFSERSAMNAYNVHKQILFLILPVGKDPHEGMSKRARMRNKWEKIVEEKKINGHPMAIYAKMM